MSLHLWVAARLGPWPDVLAWPRSRSRRRGPRRQGLRYALGAVKESHLKSLLVAETADSLTLRRPDGRIVTIECLPATRGGSALRGRTLVGVVLDECAFFRDSDYTVNDADIFSA